MDKSAALSNLINRGYVACDRQDVLVMLVSTTLRESMPARRSLVFCAGIR